MVHDELGPHDGAVGIRAHDDLREVLRRLEAPLRPDRVSHLLTARRWLPSDLSGGQKQRASLARALARRPSIVLLDDALSAVDTHTEAEILRALREALTSRTAVIASHRVSAIRDASWIIVLDEGKVVEQGKHDQLMAAEGRYWALLRRQQLVESIEKAEDSQLQLQETVNG